MEHYQIVNIQEVLEQKEGVAYQGEIGVFVPDNTRDFALAEGNPVYVNAFSYVLVLGGSAALSVDEHVYEILQIRFVCCHRCILLVFLVYRMILSACSCVFTKTL